MFNIRYVLLEDKEFWFKLDRHLSEVEFDRKVRDRMGFVLIIDDIPVGVLRYNLFWDNTPFCTLLFIDWDFQRMGHGKSLLLHWEKEMRDFGYGMVMTSTQVDENAQHFYRKLGYHDAGGLIIHVPDYKQPMELFFVKEI